MGVMYPYDDARIIVSGKGGSFGKKFMMEKGIEMLKAQGHSGDRNTIMMIGDRFDTDIRGGVSAGIKSCLVESGAHSHTQQAYFPDDSATWWARNVGELVV